MKANRYFKERRTYYIYIHTCPNKKCYVGLSKNPKQRWNNGEGYKANKEFYKDIKTFGWNNIEHEIVAKTNYGWIARGIEKDLILKFKKQGNAYNIINEKKPGYISKRKIPLKKVAQYDKNGNLIKVYKSASEAGKCLMKSSNNIQDCCRGRTRTSGGYVWKYI